MYFKNIVRKITADRKAITKIVDFKCDKEVYEFLIGLTSSSKDKVNDIFYKHYGVEVVDVLNIPIDKSIFDGLDIRELITLRVLPLQKKEADRLYMVAINNIMDANVRDTIKNLFSSIGYRVKFYFSFDEDISLKFGMLDNVIDQAVIKPKIVPKIEKDIVSLRDVNPEQWVNDVLIFGIRNKASDIHIEAIDKGIQVRYRIDGVLTNKTIYNLHHDDISGIYVRLKIISELDITEKRKPQNGRIDDYFCDGKHYDLRVSSVNTMFGEKIVMRIFDKTEGILTYEQIGFSKTDEDKILKMLRHNNGIVYLSGATGSGKTTTLYSMIDTLNDDSLNIYTIEDPVEMTIENINQVQIDNLVGIDYPNTLRALLRQDPDVIVVGEIRDTITADLSIRASLTGHLVLSTLHANSAIDSISRLLDMEIESYLISASSIGFLSQRLIRKVCPHCAIKGKPTMSQEIWLNQTLEDHNLEAPSNMMFSIPIGCDKCTDGYSGRTALVEIVEVTDDIKRLLSQNRDIAEIKDQALKDGFTPIHVSGIHALFDGITSIEELMNQLN